MKKLLSVLGLVLLFESTVFAAPFVLTASQPSDQVSSYIVTVDSTDYPVPVEKLADGTVRCKYDLTSTLPSGSHTVTVKSINMWGASSSVPFTFTKAVPPTPTGISLSAQ